MTLRKSACLVPFILLAHACGNPGKLVTSSHTKDSNAVTVSSAIPAERLATIKEALPKVAYPKLQDILNSQQTFWYDHESMKTSYQSAISLSDTKGANSNDSWFKLIAPQVQNTAMNFYAPGQKHWRFPFGSTAGTDQSTNTKIVNFLWLPQVNGKLLPVAVDTQKSTPIDSLTQSQSNSWGWVYPVGSMLGEVILLRDGNAYLPSEIRVRTRYQDGWSTNAFRPFPTAQSLSQAIKSKRPNWESQGSLKSLIAHLENQQSLTSKHLQAPQIPGVFDEDGSLDVLPDFGDDALVRDLLRHTTFVSAYGTVWKSSGGKSTYAASTAANLSIVPNNYEVGVIAVNENSCMRCHQETGRSLTAYKPEYSDILLYGEVWGRDGIFTFHPFDETQYANFKTYEVPDNRRLNPNLARQGLIIERNSAGYQAPLYPKREIGNGKKGFNQ